MPVRRAECYINRCRNEQGHDAMFAFYHSGVNPADLKSSLTGFFFGSCFQETNNDFDDPQAIPNYNKSMATRVSQFFQFKGPLLHADTACGSSLSAFNEAVSRSLRNLYRLLRLPARKSSCISLITTLASFAASCNACWALRSSNCRWIKHTFQATRVTPI